MRISSELRDRIYTTVHADSTGSSAVDSGRTVTLSEAQWRLLLGAAEIGIHRCEQSATYGGATGREPYNEAWQQIFGS